MLCTIADWNTRDHQITPHGLVSGKKALTARHTLDCIPRVDDQLVLFESGNKRRFRVMKVTYLADVNGISECVVYVEEVSDVG